MKALLGLAGILVGICVALAQPMAVEWEQDLNFFNDSLRDFECIGLIEDPESGSLYIAGRADNYFSNNMDSSDAVVFKLTPDGEVLWSRVYDSGGLYWFGRGVSLEAGNIAFGRYSFGVVKLNSSGELLEEYQYRCALWPGDVEVLTKTSSGRIVTGTRCLIDGPMWIETGSVTCIGPNGDSLWTVERQFDQYTFVRQILALPGDSVLASMVGHGQGGGRHVVIIDAAGNVVEEQAFAQGEYEVLALRGDTLWITAADAGTGNLVLRKRLLDHTLISERTFEISGSSNYRILETRGNQIRLLNNDGLFALFSMNLDSLWSMQLPVESVWRAISLNDRGLLIETSPEEFDDPPHLIRMSSPLPRIIASDEELDFGYTEPNQAVERQLTLSNIYLDSILVTSVAAPEPFTVSTEGPFWIYYDAPAVITIEFLPTEPIDYIGTLAIEANTPFGTIEVALRGSANPNEADEYPVLVKSFALHPPYPNPFNPSTTLSFELPRRSDVTLSIFDIGGRLVTELVSGNLSRGSHSINWTCPECASGIYFATMTARDFSATQKLLLLK